MNLTESDLTAAIEADELDDFFRRMYGDDYAQNEIDPEDRDLVSYSDVADPEVAQVFTSNGHVYHVAPGAFDEAVRAPWVRPETADEAHERAMDERAEYFLDRG
jgi:hypothetical protein